MIFFIILTKIVLVFGRRIAHMLSSDYAKFVWLTYSKITLFKKIQMKPICHIWGTPAILRPRFTLLL